MRPQEVCHLTRLDFDFIRDTIYIADSKRHKDRCIAVSHSVIVNHMSKDAIASILGCIDASSPKGLRDCFFLTLMYDTAARNGEMLKLKLSDVSVDRANVYLFGKCSKARLVPLAKETLAMFEKYKATFHKDGNPESFMFYTKHNGEKTPMSDDNVARFLKLYVVQAHKQNPHVPEKVHPHMIRHSRAMHLYQGGMPLSVLSEFLGHEDPETTLIYAYADTEMKRQAVEKAAKSLPLPDMEGDLPIWEDADIIGRLVRGY